MSIIIITVNWTNCRLSKFVLICLVLTVFMYWWLQIKYITDTVKNMLIDNINHDNDNDGILSTEKDVDTTGMEGDGSISTMRFISVGGGYKIEPSQQGSDCERFPNLHSSTIGTQMSSQITDCLYQNITGFIFDGGQIVSEVSNNQNNHKLSTDNWSTIHTTTTAADLNIKIIENYTYALTERSQWMPIPATRSCSTLLQLPVNKIYVSETKSKNCYTYSQCNAELHNILAKDKLIWGDIQYNFVVSGDGTIFEGLSWRCRVYHDWTDNSSIWVSLTGGLIQRNGLFLADNKITDKQYDSLQLLITANVISGNISPRYQLLPRCCLLSGKNPSKEVFKRIGSFKSFCGFPCINKEQCEYCY